MNVFPTAAADAPETILSGAESNQTQLHSGDDSFQKYLDRLDAISSDTEIDPLETALDTATIAQIDVTDAVQFFQVELTEPNRSLETVSVTDKTLDAARPTKIELLPLLGDLNSPTVSRIDPRVAVDSKQSLVADQFQTAGLTETLAPSPLPTQSLTDEPTELIASAENELLDTSTLSDGLIVSTSDFAADSSADLNFAEPSPAKHIPIAEPISLVETSNADPALNLLEPQTNFATASAAINTPAPTTIEPPINPPISKEPTPTVTVQNNAPAAVAPNVTELPSPQQPIERQIPPSANQPIVDRIATGNSKSDAEISTEIKADLEFIANVDPTSENLTVDSTIAEATANTAQSNFQHKRNEVSDSETSDVTPELAMTELAAENVGIDLSQEQGNPNPNQNQNQNHTSNQPSENSQPNANVSANASVSVDPSFPNHTPLQSFSQTVNNLSSPNVAAETTFPAPEFSQPTSQLKIAILAQAASIENDSTHSIQLDLHPAELGHLQIRIEQTGDSLTAKIIATEIASSELLIQDRQHLLETLSELGLGEASVDITHGDARGQDQEQDSATNSTFSLSNIEEKPAEAISSSSSTSIGIDFVA